MKQYFAYLDCLRDSGVGAVPYLQETFPKLCFDRAQAVYILQEWMAGRRDGGDDQC